MKNEKHLMTKMMMNDCEEIKQAQKIILECDAVLITTGTAIASTRRMSERCKAIIPPSIL